VTLRQSIRFSYRSGSLVPKPSGTPTGKPPIIPESWTEQLSKKGGGTVDVDPNDGGGDSQSRDQRADFLSIAHSFDTLAEAKRLIQAWRPEYDESRPYRSIGERTLASSPVSTRLAADSLQSKPAED
jgi:hypothetical protein